MDDLAAVMAVLRSTRFRWASEDDLQRGIEAALLASGIDAVREVRCGPGERLDLLVGQVGIEVKVKGDWRGVLRQLRRYAEHDEVAALVLVTSVVAHAAHLPELLNDKPAQVHLVGTVV